jgi:hypothetical protein
MTASNNPAKCSIKQSLIEATMEATERLIDLTNREEEAVIRGDLETMVALARSIEEARIKRENAIVSLQFHMREHGC